MTIFVCPLSRLPENLARHQPERVVSLLDPDMEFPDLGPAYADRHLRLMFHDIHVPCENMVVPGAKHIDLLLTFLKQWNPQNGILIHCRAGIGRSTAAAFVAACLHNPEVDELQIAAHLRSASPFARPNETLIRIADMALGRKGRMSAAIASTGENLPWLRINESEPFQLPARFPRRVG
jgi:predicted protein tyrosine phosphatase